MTTINVQYNELDNATFQFVSTGKVAPNTPRFVETLSCDRDYLDETFGQYED